MGATDVATSLDRRGEVAAFTPEQVETACAFVDASLAASTRAKYEQHWAAFGAWYREHGHAPVPTEPALVAVHLSDLAAAGLPPQTLALRLAVIGHAYRGADEVAPRKRQGGTVILNVLAGARRAWGKPPADDVVWAMLHGIKGQRPNWSPLGSVSAPWARMPLFWTLPMVHR